MAIIYQVDLSDKSERFSKEECVVSENQDGISITPRLGHELGWRRKFFPWGEIRRIKEYSSDSTDAS